jgi:maleate isomerase
MVEAWEMEGKHLLMVASAPYVVEDEGACLPTLGLVVLQAEETIEDEFRHYLRDRSVILHHTRIPSGEAVTRETLSAMETDLAAAIRLFPIGGNFDVIGYACTSASSVIGEDRVASLITSARPGVQPTNPATAAKTGLRALGVRRIAVLTPYNIAVTGDIVKMFEAGGFDISSVTTFNEEVEANVARITPQSILEAAVAAGEGSEAEAVFISCTNLRCAGVIAAAEERLGKPVLSSNLALLWHMLTLAGIETRGIAESRLLGF